MFCDYVFTCFYKIIIQNFIISLIMNRRRELSMLRFPLFQFRSTIFYSNTYLIEY